MLSCFPAAASDVGADVAQAQRVSIQLVFLSSFPLSLRVTSLAGTQADRAPRKKAVGWPSYILSLLPLTHAGNCQIRVPKTHLSFYD